jgi:outer membrane biosynthesis protein TonB
MKKNKVTGLVGTIVLHVALLLLLLLVAITQPKAQEEGGVPVMLGNMEMAQGNADPYTLTDVDILDEPQLPSEVSAPEPVPTPPVKTEMITQEDEPTVAVPKKETPKPKVKTETVKKETPKKEPVKLKE